MDSRFRGNDCALERPYLSNDTSTQAAGLCGLTGPTLQAHPVDPTKLRTTLLPDEVLLDNFKILHFAVHGVSSPQFRFRIQLFSPSSSMLRFEAVFADLATDK